MKTRFAIFVRQNSVGLVALFFVISGGVAWALEANTVGSKQIKRGAVASSDVKDDGLTGRDIKEPSLKGVLRCPAGMIRTADLCYEPADRSPAGQDQATVACAIPGLRMPTVAEGLLMVRDLPTPAVQVDYWTADKDKIGGLGVYRDTGGTPPFGVTQNDVNAQLAFRCVTSPRA